VINAAFSCRPPLEAGRLSLGPRPRPHGLGADDVHLWYASIVLPAPTVEALRKILSFDELERAGRQRAVEDQDRFIAARGQLRVILASYLSVSPERVRFTCGPYGKPALACGFEGDLRFNLAHAGGVALYAIARGREVGVDLERICVHPIDEQLANQYFSLRENETLHKLPLLARAEAFSRFWTRREAYGKARGEGIPFLRRRFDLVPMACEPVAVVETEVDSHHPSRWFLRDLDPGPGYTGTLVVEGRGWRLECGRLQSQVSVGREIVLLTVRGSSRFAHRPNRRDKDEDPNIRTSA
jgi:4'-phosphopantetheinyl transferase